jgi:hypothetical protein
MGYGCGHVTGDEQNLTIQIQRVSEHHLPPFVENGIPLLIEDARRLLVRILLSPELRPYLWLLRDACMPDLCSDCLVEQRSGRHCRLSDLLAPEEKPRPTKPGPVVIPRGSGTPHRI